jgi:ABC-type sulfate/molybdate transport systems ATPase subunit
VLLHPKGRASHDLEEVTSLADKTQGLEDGLAQVSTERDALKAEVERKAAPT